MKGGRRMSSVELINLGKSERDNVISERYGIGKSRLTYIRNTAKDSVDRALKMATDDVYSSTKDPSEITTYLIGNIIFRGGGESNTTKFRRFLNSKYYLRRHVLSSAGLNAPNIYFLKKDLGLSETNIEEVFESELYKNFEASQQDFFSELVLPTKLDNDVSNLVGFVYVAKNKSDNGNKITIRKKKTKEVCDNWFVPKMKEIFNADVIKRKYGAEVESKLIKSWFSESLDLDPSEIFGPFGVVSIDSDGMPERLYDENIVEAKNPFTKFNYNVDGLISGFAAGMELTKMYGVVKNYLCLQFESYDEEKVNNVKKVFDSNFYNTTTRNIKKSNGKFKKRLSVILAKEEVDRITFFNPTHRALVDDVYDKMPSRVKKRN
jgi:hypothetical protein